MTKRVGRPPIPKTKRREHRVMLNFNSDELAKLKELAETEDISPAEWARRVVQRALRGRTK
jgi:hypothetical protein